MEGFCGYRNRLTCGRSLEDGAGMTKAERLPRHVGVNANG